MQLNKHFLQSEAWGHFQEKEGNRVYLVEGDSYSISAVLKSTSLGNYLFCPYGPMVKDFQALQICLDELKRLANETNSFFVRIEPTVKFENDQLESLGFVKSCNINVNATWILDLDKEEDELVSGMHKRLVRYWRNREKKGITIRQSKDPKDVDALYDFVKACGEDRGWISETKEYLVSQLEEDFAVLYVVELQTDTNETIPLSSAIMFDYGDTRFYAHASSSPDDKYRKLQANGILLIQAILDAKESGKEHFDFWGITLSDDENHPYAGFTKFKKSFSGRVVEYSGTWDLPISNLKYNSYLTLRKINRAIRRIRYH